MKVNPIPTGYERVVPYLIVDGAAQAIEFYKAAFGAVEVMRLAGTEGKLGHAELRIGASVIMLADEFPPMGALSPKTLGGSSVGLLIYVPDVDAQFKQALAAGGTELRPVQDQFYGDRSGTLLDPFGHKWSLSTRKEDLTPEEMNTRAAKFMQAQGCKEA